MGYTISVFEAGFLKPGPPITNATFRPITYPGLGKPPVIGDPLAASEVGAGIYDVEYFQASGDLQVSAPSHQSNKVTVYRGGGIPGLSSFEVWLTKST